MIDFFGTPFVYIVTSTNFDEQVSIIQVSGNETVANDLVATLTDADTACEYSYEVVKKPIVR